MGLSEDLDQASKLAVRENRDEAYLLCSLAATCTSRRRST